MAQSTLRQVLAAFENGSAHSLGQIARDLDISQAQLEGMIHYWVRKGKIRETAAYMECGSCGHSDNGCPFVLEMPRHYELVTTTSQTIPLALTGVTCSHHRQEP